MGDLTLLTGPVKEKLSAEEKIAKNKQRETYTTKDKQFILKNVCFDFQNTGRCKRGDRCTYGHVPAEKTICLEFRVRGICKKRNCRYAHQFDNGIFDFANSSFAVKQMK